jgi:hypothetical protein
MVLWQVKNPTFSKVFKSIEKYEKKRKKKREILRKTTFSQITFF